MAHPAHPGTTKIGATILFTRGLENTPFNQTRLNLANVSWEFSFAFKKNDNKKRSYKINLLNQGRGKEYF